MLDHGDGASKARFSPDELEVAGILLDFPDTILHGRVLHWGATRRRSVPAAPVACSPDTPLSFPASWPELSPPAKKPKIPVFSALRPPHRQNLASSLLRSLLYKQSQVTSTCGDSQRVDLLLKSMVMGLLLLRSRIGLRIMVTKVLIFLLLLLDVVAGSASIEQYQPAIGPERAIC